MVKIFPNLIKHYKHTYETHTYTYRNLIIKLLKHKETLKAAIDKTPYYTERNKDKNY